MSCSDRHVIVMLDILAAATCHAKKKMKHTQIRPHLNNQRNSRIQWAFRNQSGTLPTTYS